jgi:hypothetical protein
MTLFPLVLRAHTVYVSEDQVLPRNEYGMSKNFTLVGTSSADIRLKAGFTAL